MWSNQECDLEAIDASLNHVGLAGVLRIRAAVAARAAGPVQVLAPPHRRRLAMRRILALSFFFSLFLSLALCLSLSLSLPLSLSRSRSLSLSISLCILSLSLTHSLTHSHSLSFLRNGIPLQRITAPYQARQPDS
jgi:hypothetical protein